MCGQHRAAGPICCWGLAGGRLLVEENRGGGDWAMYLSFFQEASWASACDGGRVPRRWAHKATRLLGAYAQNWHSVLLVYLLARGQSKSWS